MIICNENTEFEFIDKGDNMKKRVLVAVALCMMLTLSMMTGSILTANAKTISTDNGIEFNDGTGTITGYLQDDSKLIIPQVIEGIDVVEIADAAFANSGNLVEIEIPASVTKIADNAFADNSAITIYGEKDSAAETFAADNKIEFVAEKLTISDESEQPATANDEQSDDTAEGTDFGIMGYIVIVIALAFLLRALIGEFTKRRK